MDVDESHKRKNLFHLFSNGSYFLSAILIMGPLLSLLGGPAFFLGPLRYFVVALSFPIAYSAAIVILLIVGYLLEKRARNPQETAGPVGRSSVPLGILGAILLVFFGPLTYANISHGGDRSAAQYIWLLCSIGSITLIIYGLLASKKP